MTSVILDVGTRAVFHTALMLALYLLFVGHNAPGGGFIGGLVGGAALVLRYVSLSREEMDGLLRGLRPEPLLGLGLLLAAGMGFAGFAIERSFLGAAMVDVTVPLLGEIHIGSTLVFDIGVFLVVVGLVLMILETAGSERGW